MKRFSLILNNMERKGMRNFSKFHRYEMQIIFCSTPDKMLNWSVSLIHSSVVLTEFKFLYQVGCQCHIYYITSFFASNTHKSLLALLFHLILFFKKGNWTPETLVFLQFLLLTQMLFREIMYLQVSGCCFSFYTSSCP